MIYWGRKDIPELIFPLRILHSCYYVNSEDISVTLLDNETRKALKIKNVIKPNKNADLKNNIKEFLDELNNKKK